MNYINHFRPIYEVRPLIFWPFVTVGIFMSDMPYGWAFALACIAMLAIRAVQVWRALSFRMAISTRWLSRIQIGRLLETQRKMREREDSMFLGTGFEWTQKHTQIAHDILRMPVTDIPSLPKWLNRTQMGRAVEQRIELLFAPRDTS
jgi:conjugal transfer pilus assembly protein TraD